jgi:hypothetical protein
MRKIPETPQQLLARITQSEPSKATPVNTSTILQKAPKPGVYYSANPIFGTFRREIAKQDSRMCIKIVDGSAASNPKQRSHVIVSSLSPRQDGFFIDANQEKLNLSSVYTEFSDHKSTWRQLEPNVNIEGLMKECLASKKPFVRQIEDDKR